MESQDDDLDVLLRSLLDDVCRQVAVQASKAEPHGPLEPPPDGDKQIASEEAGTEQQEDDVEGSNKVRPPSHAHTYLMVVMVPLNCTSAA